MSTSLSTSLKIALGWVHTNALDLGDVKDSNRLQIEDGLTDGAGLDAAEEVWHDRRTLAASSNDDLDLAGALSNAFGQTVNFAKVKAIAIQNRTTTVGAIIEIGGGDDGSGNNAFASWLGDVSDKIKIGPDGIFLLWNPSLAAYAVTASTADILRIQNTSGSDSVDYDIVIIGTLS